MDIRTKNIMETNLVKREDIIGSRRIENYVWIVLLTIGGVGFLLAAGSWDV